METAENGRWWRYTEQSGDGYLLARLIIVESVRHRCNGGSDVGEGCFVLEQG